MTGEEKKKSRRGLLEPSVSEGVSSGVQIPSPTPNVTAV